MWKMFRDWWNTIRDWVKSKVAPDDPGALATRPRLGAIGIEDKKAAAWLIAQHRAMYEGVTFAGPLAPTSAVTVRVKVCKELAKKFAPDQSQHIIELLRRAAYLEDHPLDHPVITDLPVRVTTYSVKKSDGSASFGYYYVLRDQFSGVDRLGPNRVELIIFYSPEHQELVVVDMFDKWHRSHEVEQIETFVAIFKMYLKTKAAQ